MVSVRRSSARLPALLLACGAGAVLLLFSEVAFVPQPGARSSHTSLRATAQETETEKEAGFSLPKPDLSIMGAQSKVGSTYDQDKRGNMWSKENRPSRTDEEELLPAGIYLPVVAIMSFAAIAFFAQLTGTDPRFGGGIGDGSFDIGD
mmetsp:Transcript_111709/g.238630  ORF Transcript_111709/g.238630 Transcript_111709/m.238630 type:complete len:148 (+) Transcript_111709:119-562(+)